MQKTKLVCVGIYISLFWEYMKSYVNDNRKQKAMRSKNCPFYQKNIGTSDYVD